MKENEEIKFSFEGLDVWQNAADFADKGISLVNDIKTDIKHHRTIDIILAKC